MSCDFSIKATNLSQDAFELRSYSACDNALCTINQVPSQTLKGGHGIETLAWTQAGSAIASGSDISVEWSTPKGRSFGVKIVAPLQIGPFGSAPYYQIKVDDGDWDGGRHGESYTFDKDLLGYNIEVKPVATHSHLYVDINITDSE
jgi:hypothetical protein